VALTRLPDFERFIDDLRTIWKTEPDMHARMLRAQPKLEQLLNEPALLEHSKGWPSTEPTGKRGMANLLLYEDPDFDFVVNAVVRTPGRKGGVHDHAHAWVLYGILDGTESLERYDRIDDARTDGFAELRLASVTESARGKVDLVPPFAIHAECGGPTRSVGVIVRSERVAGRVPQRSYNVAGKSVVERAGPVQIAYELTCA
jgi:predicted metal-dependent enzyme (double-stranded beta helix superfamily)